MRRVTLVLSGLIFIAELSAQTGTEKPGAEKNGISADSITFSTSSASKYIIDLVEMDKLWRSTGITMKNSLSRLVDHFNEPFDSVGRRLSSFNYDSVKIRQIQIVQNDTIPLRWLNDSTFIIDTIRLEKEPFIIKETILRKITDTTQLAFEDILEDNEAYIDSLFSGTQLPNTEIFPDSVFLPVQDTIREVFIDTVFLESLKIQMYRTVNDRIVPPLFPPVKNKSARFLPDSAKIIVSETSMAFIANKESPFYMVPGKKLPDSLRVAVSTLLSFISDRDSIQLFFNDIQGNKTSFWLTRGREDMYRYWVKNYKNDSITIWIGNPSRNDITLVLEQDINVMRLQKEAADKMPVTMAKPDRSLAKVEPLKNIPVYWDYGFSSSFALNQTYLSNWSKGGENSFASVLDITGSAKYNNTEEKKVWANSARLKYGTIITEEYGLRKNNDMLELNSQYNKVLREKIDFTAVFYMKNQLAKGYDYPNDSVVISRFLNPGTFTIGLGMEYKPNKKTSFNFAPLSYKNTFVLDTANIDQTLHGIPADKRAKQEMGGQLVITNKINFLKDLNISSSARLFSGYLNHPQNIDVDWEINLEKRINIYFAILMNIHMIYDDDVRFPVLDDDDQPVLLPDGSKKKVPRLQFKQYLGLTFLFKL